MASLTFHGAAQTVTGSKYLLEAGGKQVLIDCGLFQGLKALRDRNWAGTPFDVKTLDKVLLTHAHLDHVGYLPRVVREGFGGEVLCNSATKELAEIIMRDSAKIQEADAEYANRKGFSKHKPALPLYTADDVTETMSLFRTIEREEWFQVTGPIWARFHDAGHLLGSNMIEVEVREGARPLRILFSGDVGRYDGPLYHDPAEAPECDYLICESTYGDRDHPDTHILDELEAVVNRGVARGGVMLMAVFAVGRAQQMVYLLNVLECQNRIPKLPVFIDSPMAVDATKVFRAHAIDHDLTEGELCGDKQMLSGRNVQLSRTVDESKAINHVKGPAIIMSSSGMMTGGRILHHLKQRLPDKRNTIIMGGYMSEGTRGRHLQDGAPLIKLHGMEIPVHAAIDKVPGLSGHADRRGLLRWLSALKTAPRKTFLTHGEIPAMTAFAERLRAEKGWNVHLPALGERAELE
jgi:metallo-beta-lactamase family protein